MRTLSLLEQTKLIVISYSGELCMDELIKDMRIDLSHYAGSQQSGLIIDFTHAKLLFGPHDLDPIRNILLENQDRITFLQVALILDLPIPTATMLLLGEKVSTPNVQFKVFSTIEAARMWHISA